MVESNTELSLRIYREAFPDRKPPETIDELVKVVANSKDDMDKFSDAIDAELDRIFKAGE